MEKIKLGDLCKTSAGQIKEDEDTLIDYIDISSVDNETKKVTGYQTITFGEAPSRARKAVKRGSVLVSTVRPNLNAVALLEEDTPNVSVASTGFCVLESKDDVDPRFILNFCKSKTFIDDMVSQATGASYPAVSDKIVRSALVPKYSYQEQQHISNVLDKLAGIIDGRRIELQQLDDLIKARFVELFGDPIKNTKSLKVRRLEEIGTWNSGGTPSRTKPEYFTGDINWYSAGELNSLYLHGSIEKITAAAIEESAAKLFRAGSMLVGMYDTAAFKMGILKEDSASNQACACIEPNESVNIVWLYYALSLMKENYLSQRRGVRQKNLNLGMIRGFELPVAEKIDQDEFVTFVKQVDKSKVAVQKALDETQTLFNSLMQEYFG